MSSADIIGILNVVAQCIVAGVAVWAVLASLHANKKQIKASEAQITRQIEESRRLTTEERRHQSRPIIAPREEVFHNMVTYFNPETGKSSEDIYTSEQKINWGWQHEIKIKLDNVGHGPAFNLHCLLYGNEPACQNQFASWNNGPIGAESPITIDLTHPSTLYLFHKDSLDGEHPLYDQSLNAPSNPALDRIAWLTMTYQDLLGTKYMGIFTYTVQHKWLHITTKEIPGEHPLDLKELNSQKKQTGPKFSAPPIITAQGI